MLGEDPPVFVQVLLALTAGRVVKDHRLRGRVLAEIAQEGRNMPHGGHPLQAAPKVKIHGEVQRFIDPARTLECLAAEEGRFLGERNVAGEHGGETRAFGSRP